MLVLTFKDTGEKIGVAGDSIAGFELLPRYKGNVTVLLANGRVGSIANSEIRMIEVVPDSEIEKRQEEMKKEKEEADARAAEEAKKAEVEKAVVAVRRNAFTIVEAWNELPWWKKVGHKVPRNVVSAQAVLNTETSATAPIPAKTETPKA